MIIIIIKTTIIIIILLLSKIIQGNCCNLRAINGAHFNVNLFYANKVYFTVANVSYYVRRYNFYLHVTPSPALH